MIRTQFITIYGQTVGVERESISEGYTIPSVLLICPICQTMWGRLTLQDDKFWVPQIASCIGCNWSSDRRPVPGSILDNDITSSGVDLSLLAALPKDLLERELTLTIQAAVSWSNQDIIFPERNVTQSSWNPGLSSTESSDTRSLEPDSGSPPIS